MINVNNVRLQFGGRVLFEDVNLKFEDGNCYGIIGANGAGKSTFLKLITKQIEPSSGDIVIDKGKIIAKGDTYDIFENPRKVQVARLTGCKNISKIEILDEYHLKSLEWGLTFELSKTIASHSTLP